MELGELQDWVRKEFGLYVDQMTPEHQLAFLLEQAGQLAQGVIHHESGNIEKEVAEVLLAVTGLANKHGVDMEKAVEAHLMSRAGDLLKKINLFPDGRRSVNTTTE